MGGRKKRKNKPAPNKPPPPKAEGSRPATTSTLLKTFLKCLGAAVSVLVTLSALLPLAISPSAGPLSCDLNPIGISRSPAIEQCGSGFPSSSWNGASGKVNREGKALMNDKEANCRADLDAALAALKESNRLLIRSIATRDIRAVERQTIKLRASR